MGRTLVRLGYPPDVVPALLSMGVANSSLIDRTVRMLETHVAHRVVPKGCVGSAEFNLTLVNKMEPDAPGTKREGDYGMGNVSVGWHRDSGLRDYSSIAVYQTLVRGTTTMTTKTTNAKTRPETRTIPSSTKTVRGDGAPSSSSWGVALRAMDGGSGGPLPNVPPLLVPLPSGSVYYMLDDFNHNHEHAVISPSVRGGDGTTRYSSTHRVAREGRGTWKYIREKARGVRGAPAIVSNDTSSSSSSRKKERETIVSRVRAEQNLMTEIEFEWLRQWFVQGRRHASLHPYWHGPIRVLCDAYRHLEGATSDVLDLLSQNNGDAEEEGRRSRIVTEDLFDVLIESLTERSVLRASWKERYRDPIYADIPEDERPFSCPCLDREGRNGDGGGRPFEDLDSLVSKLRRWRSAFVSFEKKSEAREGDGGGKIMIGAKKPSKTKSVGSLTKKESKQRASNWERLKANLKR